MDHDPVLPSSYVKMEDDDDLDYMAGFGPVDPQLGLPLSASIAPAQLSAPTAAPPETGTASWDSSIESVLGQLVAASASETSHAETPSESSKKSRASSNSTAPSVEPTAPKPARRRQSRRKSPAKENDEDEDGDEDSKRSAALKRNRVAASKCRQKKKVWQHSLEEQKSDLERQHAALLREYNELLAEASQMKNSLMVHAGCGDPKIDAWIDNEAMQFVKKSGAPQPSHGHHKNDAKKQTSPIITGLPSPPTPMLTTSSINYDHMTDEMFADDTL